VSLKPLYFSKSQIIEKKEEIFLNRFCYSVSSLKKKSETKNWNSILQKYNKNLKERFFYMCKKKFNYNFKMYMLPAISEIWNYR